MKQRLRHKPDLTAWEELDSDVQTALVTWFNRTKITNADKERLAVLATEGRFWHWHCLLCDAPCVHAELMKEEWDYFQGCADDIDLSYFGNPEVYTSAALMAMCDSCRMNGCKRIPDGAPPGDD